MRTESSSWATGKSAMPSNEWDAIEKAARAAHYAESCDLSEDSEFIQEARRAREIAGYGGFDD